MPISLLFNPFRRDNLPPEEVLDEELPVAPDSATGACRARSLLTFTGILRDVKVNPQGQRRWLEGELDDGSGPVTLVWMGRDHIAGIEEGVRLKIRGRVVNRRGRSVVYNPHYELVRA